MQTLTLTKTQATSTQIFYNLIIKSKKTCNKKIDIVGKYIVPLNNKNYVKKVIIYKSKFNSGLLNGLQFNKITKELCKKVNLLE